MAKDDITFLITVAILITINCVILLDIVMNSEKGHTLLNKILIVTMVILAVGIVVAI